jgi:hypothetical protein
MTNFEEVLRGSRRIKSREEGDGREGGRMNMHE